MKDLADFIRYLTPSLTDDDRHSCVSYVHGYAPIVLLLIFAFSKSIPLKIFCVLIITVVIYLDLTFKECPLSLLEREFCKDDSKYEWDDILSIFFKTFGWKLTRGESVASFAGAYISGFLVFTVVTLSECFYCLIN
jgi:hypothetical protein